MCFEFQLQDFTPSLSVDAFGIDKLQDVSRALMEGGASCVPYCFRWVEELLFDLTGTTGQILCSQDQDDGLCTEWRHE